MEESQQYPQISVVIPTHNEAQNLHYVLPRIPSIVSEVILVDGHSSDDTIEVAQQLMPSIRIFRQQEKGKGDALRIGFAESTGNIIVMIDADGSTDPKEIIRFIDALLQGNDFAKGSRFIQGGGSHDITALRALGNFGLSQLVNMLFGTRYSDLCYGYNAFWKRSLDCIHLDCNGFEIETQLNIRMHMAGLKITEVPSIERPRLFGQSHLRTFRDGWRVLKMIMMERIRLNRTEVQKVPVLMYHSISDHTNPKFKQFVVSPKLFAEHMAYLHQHKYTPITVSQFVAALTHRGNKLPDRPVVLTFDDGFADFYTVALPIIKRYGFTATLYTATAYINGTSRWLQHEGETARPMLTWEQLGEINASGIECGGHSHSHPQLDTLSQAEAYSEILQCKRHLEDHLHQEVLSFAYPFGYHTASIRRQVQEAGYTSACAVKFAMSSEKTDPFALARLIVRPNTTQGALASLLSGHSSPVLATIYARARTPVWQIVRRGASSMTRRLQKEW
jgi:peptidoglycan/xylan/chitin deacetylase (PgdA/CDA1 family)